MEDSYLNYKREVEKINQRIKEYLWKKWYSKKTWSTQSKNCRNRFLERQSKFTKDNKRKKIFWGFN